MSVVYLLLGDRDSVVKGIITPDGFFIFSIYDFLQKVLIGNKNRTYVKKLWHTLCTQNIQFMYVQGTLGLTVTSSKMPIGFLSQHTRVYAKEQKHSRARDNMHVHEAIMYSREA